MKYALINDIKAEAIKGAKGICSNCGAELIAKCGVIKMRHWAHRGDLNCDPWLENETEWHRSWKNNYSAASQEISLLDEINNERHIADVRTGDGLVIEFQHSHIDPNERDAREKFYKNMVWVVDGTRLKGDYPRFLKGKSDFRSSDDPQIFYFDTYDECFSSAWIGRSVPVIIDFKGFEKIDDPDDHKNYLYCLQPNIDSKYAFLAKLSRQNFIESTTTGEWSAMIKSYFGRPNKYQLLQQAYAMQNFSLSQESPYVFDKGGFIKRTRF